MIPVMDILQTCILITRATPRLYSLGEGWMRESLSFSADSASFSMRLTKTSHVGMSWMSPMTWPAVHT